MKQKEVQKPLNIRINEFLCELEASGPVFMAKRTKSPFTRRIVSANASRSEEIIKCRLREAHIKGVKKSQSDNPLSNLILYQFVDEVQEVFIRLSKNVGFVRVEVRDTAKPAFILNISFNQVRFLKDFNAGKYPEFEG